MKVKEQLLHVWMLWAAIFFQPCKINAQFIFTTNNGALTLANYIGNDSVVIIPNTTNGYPVMAIGYKAFYGALNTTNVQIPNSVTNIGDYAFSRCTSLTSINIPSSLNVIGNYIFSSSGVKNIVLSTNITSVGDFAFAFTPQSVFTIPYSVTNIGDGAFDGNATTAINVDTNNQYYTSINGVLFNKSKTTLMQFPSASSYYGSSYVVPNTVQCLYSHAFYIAQQITNITIPIGCTSIGNYCFGSCYGLSTITNSQNSFTISANVTNIGNAPFVNCTALKAINVDPLNINYCSVSGVLFSKDQTILIEYPAGLGGSYSITNTVTTIATNAFGGASGISGITIPNSVFNIQYGAFGQCSGLTSVLIPNSVTNIEPWAFSWCSRLSDFTFSTNMISICTNEFYQCASLQSITIPNNIQTIQDDAFDGTKLINVTIPQSVTNVGQFAFGYTPLTNITIYNGLTYIGAEAFYCVNPTTGFPSLRSVYFQGNAPSYDQAQYIFYNYQGYPIIYYMPSNNGWGTNYCNQQTQPALTYFTNNNSITLSNYNAPFSIVTIPSQINGLPVTSISIWAFSYNQIIQHVDIPNTVTNIDNGAFNNCTAITNIVIPDSVINIGISAFNGCAKLVSAYISDNINSIPNYCFYGCTSLNKVHLPQSATSIGYEAFYNCTSLTNITIPYGVTNIGGDAFYKCNQLKGMYFQGNAPTMAIQYLYAGYLPFYLYYLAGTTGWSTPIQGQLATLFNPQAQNDSSFGVTSNQFGFNIIGNSNIVLTVNACSNLANPVWTPVQTLTLTNGVSYFSDPLWTNYPSRFYSFGFAQ